ncbi:MAG: efflux RND transporter periplasmic adaptor subunit [Bacillota bacterium]|nr:efflux RND transporter periplasmic adaptor subunit [Bacillota bacterium]
MKLKTKTANGDTPDLIKKKRKKKLWISITSIIVVISLISGTCFWFSKGNATDKKTTIKTTKPVVKTLELTVSGSGTIEPYERYEIVPLVNGEITQCNYEEGDTVQKDDLLYVIDHDQQNKSIEKAQDSLKKYKLDNKTYLDSSEYNKTLAKYTIKAASDGVVSGFTLKKGDNVSANQSCGMVQDTSTVIATIPFNAAQCGKIQIGDTAKVYLFPSMYSLNGTVTYKSSASSGYSNGSVVYNVEITIKNADIALNDTSASATITTSSGNVESPKSGTISFNDSVSITPKISGEVDYIAPGLKNGTTVKKGEVLFTIDDTDFVEKKKTVDIEYNDQQLSLEDAKDKLDDYNITAPISGTVITKNYKKGDTIGTSSDSTALMVVADMSKMKFTFSADETDINKVSVGQEVKVTADALENQLFTGKVTKVATEGTSSNGVAEYDVEVVIDDYGKLRSGMNVSAEIVYQSAKDALCVPISAITKIKGESYVYVKNGTNTGVTAADDTATNAASAGSSKQTESASFKSAAISSKSTNTASDETAKSEKDINATIQKRIKAKAPEGFTAVKVTTGVSNDMYMAILSGLSQTAEVYLAENDNADTSSATNSKKTGLNATGMNGGMGGMNGGYGGMEGGMGGYSGMRSSSSGYSRSTTSSSSGSKNSSSSK